jgi:hypothetical protein
MLFSLRSPWSFRRVDAKGEDSVAGGFREALGEFSVSFETANSCCGMPMTFPVPSSRGSLDFEEAIERSLLCSRLGVRFVRWQKRNWTLKIK